MVNTRRQLTGYDDLLTHVLEESLSHTSGRKRPRTVQKPRTTLKVRLTKVNWRKIPYQTLSGWSNKGSLRAPIRSKSYWPYENYPGIKLGHNAWEHLNWEGPNVEQVHHLNDTLNRRHAVFDHQSYVSMPAHAANAGVNIDVCIQTIFAQSTGNEIAIDTHCRLRNAFPYTVRGHRVAGKIPNWHTIRCLEEEELEIHLKRGGFSQNRAKKIKELLELVYEKNVRRRKQGLQVFDHEENPPDAEDFVPGLLSLDFLVDDGLDNSTEALLGRFLELPQIGLKSAMCIMAFAMKRECFPVDVHVLRMCKWLGWIPSTCDSADKAAMFLTKYIPGPIMFNVHQAIWIHCANENVKRSDAICLVCGSSPPPKGVDIEKALRNCPLTDLLPPLQERWGKRYRLSEFSSADRTMGAQSLTVELAASSDSSEFTVPSSPGSTSAGDSADPEYNVNNRSKTKKFNVHTAATIRFEDIPDDEIGKVQAEGFLLWEFRPMDNSFMEEWGKVEKFPRYKWEKPGDTLDMDVAVSVEYAREVLSGKRPHKWTVANVGDVAVAQARSMID